jgi:hypothetical protein
VREYELDNPTKDLDDVKTISRMEVEIEYLKKGIELAGKSCETCLVRKIVYGIVSVMGLVVITALLALVIKK